MTSIDSHIRLSRQHAYEYDMVVQSPKLTVAQGHPFTVEVENSTSNRIQTDQDLPTRETLGELFDLMMLNPCAGPIAVEGAEPGDILAVDILDIVVADTGYVCIEGLGPLSESLRYPDARGPFTKIIRHLPGPSGTTSDGIGIFDDNVQWNLQPMIGTLGVAPQRPSRGSDTVTMQNRHGGNLDTREFRKGHRILIPVAHPGALLYVGDVHASQATEFGGSGDESRADVTLSCSVIKNTAIPWIRVETPTDIIQLNCYRPIDEGIRHANLWMLDWLVEEYGMSARDATLQLAVNPDVRNNIYSLNMWGTMNFTVGVSFPKNSIPVLTS
jgi:amidase